MTVFRSAAPMLPARNVPQSANFYRDVLGFSVNLYGTDFAVLTRDNVVLHLFACTEQVMFDHSGCYLYVRGVQALHDNLPIPCVHPFGQLSRKPWGLLEMTLIDLDGNCVRIGEEIGNDE